MHQMSAWIRFDVIPSLLVTGCALHSSLIVSGQKHLILWHWNFCHFHYLLCNTKFLKEKNLIKIEITKGDGLTEMHTQDKEDKPWCLSQITIWPLLKMHMY
uniref:Uncharacterized protein n=1 Tax=Sphaerodactylus townsendi TaxID=933632 RepID=A0ACB8GDP2_9SAUR